MTKEDGKKDILESITAEHNQLQRRPLQRTRSWPCTAGSTDRECNAVAVAAGAVVAVGRADATAAAEAVGANRAEVEAAAKAVAG